MASLVLVLVILLTIFAIILYNVLLIFANKHFYPSPLVKQPIPQSGKSGKDATETGVHGIDGKKAIAGSSGINGVPGLQGRSGLRGTHGNIGEVGEDGEIGVNGFKGTGGEKGPPSNSVVPVTLRYDLPAGDSYIMQSFFPYENEVYTFSLHCNIFNNSRFNLRPHEMMKLEYGFLEPGVTGAFLQTPPDPYPNGPPVSDLIAAPFLSCLRILIGRGKKGSSQTNFDDTIFYISPPIERQSFLFGYIENPILPSEYKDFDLLYPIGTPNNFRNFHFIKMEITNDVLPNSTSKVYHVLKGIGKYELVVNVFPSLPDDSFFCYRIVEEFMNLDWQKEFSLPKITFSSTATPILEEKEENGKKYLRTISSRFDINHVIQRDYSFQNLPWLQTNQTTITSFKEKTPVPKIPFENMYNYLEAQRKKMKDNVYNTAYAQIMDIPFNQIDVKNASQPIVTETITFYVPKESSGAPLNKFLNKEKLYIELTHSVPNNFDKKYFCLYGGDYTADLYDFLFFYGKRIYFSDTAKINNVPVEIIPSKGSPVKIGYTSPNGDRYTEIVAIQYEGDDLYFIDIPLFGYKKE